MKHLNNLFLFIFFLLASCQQEEIRKEKYCRKVTGKFIESIMVIENQKAFDKDFYFFVYDDKDTVMVGQRTFYTEKIESLICE